MKIHKRFEVFTNLLIKIDSKFEVFTKGIDKVRYKIWNFHIGVDKYRSLQKVTQDDCQSVTDISEHPIAWLPSSNGEYSYKSRKTSNSYRLSVCTKHNGSNNKQHPQHSFAQNMTSPNLLSDLNPLNPELNPICYLLALLGAHHFLHVRRIRVKLLTFRRLMLYIYIYGAPILDVSR